MEDSMARTAANKDEKASTSAPVPAHRDEWHPLTDLRAEMDRLIENFFHRNTSSSTGRDVTDSEHFGQFERGFRFGAPRVDVTESDKGYEIVAELPGLDQKDIELELKDDILTLSGEKKEEQEKEEMDYHLTERRFGSFRRSFRLPTEVDQNNLSADFKNGVLTIALPKTAKAQKPSKKIGIKSK
jgi:HSP20 family protein